MITKMNKLTALVYHRDYDAFLDTLRDFGKVHVQEKQRGAADAALQQELQRSARYKSCLTAMQALADEARKRAAKEKEAKHTPAPGTAPLATADAVMDELARRRNALQEAEQRLPQIDKEIEQMQVWGDYNPQTVQHLADAGWHLQFYSLPLRSYKTEWESDHNAITVQRDSVQIHFVTLTKGPAQLGVEPLHLPASGLKGLQQQRARLQHTIEQGRDELAAFCDANRPVMQDEILSLQGNIDLHRVHLNSDPMAAGSVVLLEGWYPAEDEAELKSLLDKAGVYYEMRSAEREDNAPIKLKNNRVNRLYEVITGMYGMPDYGEFDPTPLLAPFFSLFFAFCVGDAGYGLVLLALGFALKKKVGPTMAGMMNLVITLGAVTTLLGALFGTFFGINLIEANLPWLEWAKGYMIESDKLMYLSLAIGVVHVIFAMTVKAVTSTVRYGFLSSLSEWGWLLCVAGCTVTGALWYTQAITPQAGKWALVAVGSVSALGIFLFNNLKRNIFVNIGAGVWDTYNMATGLVGDVLSYIRLYALGLAGAMLGLVFNQLAFMIDIDIPVAGIILTWLLRCLILVFGHALNIAMSCLSAFVHPLRLTFVEYFKNSGYGGMGTAYSPFARVEKRK